MEGQPVVPDENRVVGGVDTHRDRHTAAALDAAGRVLGTASFPATAAGYGQLLRWLRGLGDVERVGVEGTSSYGAGLSRFVAGEGVATVEVLRPPRRGRRGHKNDPADAVAAARAVLSGEAIGCPKPGSHPVRRVSPPVPPRRLTRALEKSSCGRTGERAPGWGSTPDLPFLGESGLRATVLAVPNEVDRPLGDDLMLKMDKACRSTRDLVARNPIEPDRWDGYVVAQAWPFVTALYSGVEQALKMLLMATCPELSVRELRNQYRHDLSRLYAALAPEDADHIELHYREHRSLFEYLQQHDKCATAESFIAHINGHETASGYNWWRYALIDPQLHPATDLWTMCEIWHAVCCCLWTRRSGQGRPCERLSRRLLLPLRDIANTANVSYSDFRSDLRNCESHIDGDDLAAWVDLLVKSSRGSMDQVQAPDALRGDLDKMAQRAIEHLSGRRAIPDELLLLLPASQRDRAQADFQSVNPDEQMLLERVRRTDRDLAWDPRTGVFRWADIASTGCSEAELSGPAE